MNKVDQNNIIGGAAMKRMSPSEKKTQELMELIHGKREVKDGKELLSTFIQTAVEKTLQELLEGEQRDYLRRGRYQRIDDTVEAEESKVEGTNENRGYRNGYVPHRLKTAEGIFTVDVPQVRGTEAPFQSHVLSRFSNRSDALENLVIEMYVHGLSVRDIESSLERAMGTFVLSDTSVSEISKQLHEQYEQFRSRRFEGYDVVYLFLDAVYEPLKKYGYQTAVLCTWGLLLDGSCILLDLRIGNTESKETCLELLRDLVRRGLQTPLTITTDGAPGLTHAIDSIWPTSKRCRCWVHKMRNCQQKVPPDAWTEIKPLIEDIRDAPTYKKGEERCLTFIHAYQETYPELCRCLSDDMEASLNHLHVPSRHRIHVRTTNRVERSFVEERRRTKITGGLWDEKSLIKLVFAVLIRLNDRWSKKQFSDVEQIKLKHLRKEWRLDTPTENKPSVECMKQKRRSAGAVY
jgi:putative transposase